MPGYIANPQPSQLVALSPGNSIALVNNAAVDTGVMKTKQIAVGPDPTGNARVTVANTTNQTATVQTAPQDIDSLYQQYLTDGTISTSTTMTIATNQSVSFPVNATWLRFTFSSAPTSGSLIVTR